MTAPSSRAAPPPRILYVSLDIGWPLAFGGDIRKWNMLQGLQGAGLVDALVLRRPSRSIAAEAMAGCGQVFDVPEPEPSEADRRRYESTIGRGRLVLTRRLPLEYQGPDVKQLRARVAERVDFSVYDLVWFSKARHALALRGLVRGPIVLDGDDFEYVREWLLLRTSPWYGAKIWNYVNVAKLWACERRHHRRFTRVVRCSEPDAALHPAPNVVVIPNGTRVPDAVDRAPERRALFVGDLGYEPNRQGLEWLLRDVWPLVRTRVPDARLDLVGAHAFAALERANGTNGIVLHGFVPDLEPMYRTAAVSLVPLHAGGGTRLKILESLARAVPVVSTRIGAFGLPFGAEHGVDLADAAAPFAERCAAWLTAPDADGSRALAGRAIVAREYDWRAIRARVAALARETVLAGRGPRQVPQTERAWGSKSSI